MEEVRLVFWA